MRKKTGTIHLKEMPLFIKKYILKIQGEEKEKTGRSLYSQQSAIYKIIKEHKEARKKSASK